MLRIYGSTVYSSLTMFLFTFRVTLVDAMRSMDVPRDPGSLNSYDSFPYHVLLARILVCLLSRFTCFFVLLFLDLRLVYPHSSVLCLPFCLTLTLFGLSTRPPTRYFWTMTRL